MIKLKNSYFLDKSKCHEEPLLPDSKLLKNACNNWTKI